MKNLNILTFILHLLTYAFFLLIVLRLFPDPTNLDSTVDILWAVGAASYILNSVLLFKKKTHVAYLTAALLLGSSWLALPLAGYYFVLVLALALYFPIGIYSFFIPLKPKGA